MLITFGEMLLCLSFFCGITRYSAEKLWLEGQVPTLARFEERKDSFYFFPVTLLAAPVAPQAVLRDGPSPIAGSRTGAVLAL